MILGVWEDEVIIQAHRGENKGVIREASSERATGK